MVVRRQRVKDNFWIFCWKKNKHKVQNTFLNKCRVDLNSEIRYQPAQELPVNDVPVICTKNLSTSLKQIDCVMWNCVMLQTILLGDSGVGKTSLLVQFDTGKFQTGTFSATVGIGFTVSWWFLLQILTTSRLPVSTLLVYILRIKFKKLFHMYMTLPCLY